MGEGIDNTREKQLQTANIKNLCKKQYNQSKVINNKKIGKLTFSHELHYEKIKFSMATGMLVVCKQSTLKAKITI